MKRLSFVLFCALCISSFSGIESSPAKTTPPSFDADLYRKEAQVFSFHGDFLFWRAQEGALDYALAMTQSAWGPDNCYAQGNFQNATFNGVPGFRVGASFFRAPHYWELWALYTRLADYGSNNAVKPTAASEYLTGTWPHIFTNSVASSCKSFNSFLVNSSIIISPICL